MGIKGLNSWITTAFPGVMVNAPSAPSRGGKKKSGKHGRPPKTSTYDHVLIDANGIVHQACRRSGTEKQVFRDIVTRLDDIFQRYPPQSSAFIALDGPGPNAKMLEQRKRRIYGVLKAKRDEEAKVVGSAEYERRKAQAEESGEPWPKKRGKKRKAGLDSLQVTPGTGFMLRLRHVLEWYAAQRLGGGDGPPASWTRAVQPLVFLSGADVPGEGEIKILEHLHAAQGWTAAGGGGAQTFLLVGPDADLLLLGLSAGVPQCDVLTMDGNGKDKLFKVGVLCKRLVSKFGGGSFLRGEKESGAGLHELDFLVIAFLQGNDYLPKLPGASLQRYSNKIAKLLKENRWTGQHLLNVRHGTIVEVNLPLLVALTKASYGGDASKGGNNGSKNDNAEISTNEDSSDDKEETSEDDMGAGHSDNSSGVKEGSSPSQYLTCLAWCAAMYLKGTCPDYAVTYQYRKPPTVRELEHLHDAEPILLPSYQIRTEMKERPLHASVFSLCLLPGAAKKYVPLPLQSLMDKGGPLSDIFHNSNPSPANLVSRITEAVGSIEETNWKEEDLMAVAQGQISVFGTMQRNQSGVGGMRHPFLMASQTPLLQLQHMHPPPFGQVDRRASAKNMRFIGCISVDPNTQGAALEHWAWDPTTSNSEEQNAQISEERGDQNQGSLQNRDSDNNQTIAPNGLTRKRRQRTRKKTPLKKISCRFFSSGTCRFGMECRFSHGDLEVATSI